MLRAKTFQFSVLAITTVVFFAFLLYFDFFKPVKIVIDPSLSGKSENPDKDSDQAVEKTADVFFDPEEEYEIVEQMLKTCSKPTDCVLPTEYMARSSCRYESRCINDVCTVICPAPLRHSGATTTDRQAGD